MNRLFTTTLLTLTIAGIIGITSCNSGAKIKAQKAAEMAKMREDSINKAKNAKPYSAWRIDAFRTASGDTSKQKYLRAWTEGKFTRSNVKGAIVYVELQITKTSAGFLLKELSKTMQPAKFNGTVTLKLVGQNNAELSISATEPWTKTGGIRIKNYGENKHLAYFDMFVDFLKANQGDIKITVSDENSGVYVFRIDGRGFTNDFKSL